MGNAARQESGLGQRLEGAVFYRLTHFSLFRILLVSGLALALTAPAASPLVAQTSGTTAGSSSDTQGQAEESDEEEEADDKDPKAKPKILDIEWPDMERKDINGSLMRPHQGSGSLSNLFAKTFLVTPALAQTRAKIDPKDFDKVRMPVLLPVPYLQQADAHFYPQEYFYSATIANSTYTIEVMGTRIGMSIPEEAARMMEPEISQPERIIHSNTGVELVFTRYGASYTISVVCDDPYRDEHCTSEDFVNQVYKEMSFVGGRR